MHKIHHQRRCGVTVVALMLIATSWPPHLALSSSWNPGLLVNTETFHVIDDTDTASDLYVRFGDSLNKRLTFERSTNQFRFNDDLEIQGTASGRILHAQDQLRSSGSLIVDGSTVYLNSFANCTALETVNGLLTCGTDDGGTIAAGQGITVAGSVVSLTAAHSGTTISATTLLSGALVHAQNRLTSSGGIFVERPENSTLIELQDSTNANSVSMKTGTGNPNGVVTSQLGSIFFAHDTGRVWKNNNGASQWVEVATGSGTVHMAKMSRDAAQTIPTGTLTKIALETEEFDIGDIADPSTSNRFTIARAGKYLVTSNVTLELNNSDFVEVAIYKNGSIVNSNSARASANSQNISAQVTTVLELTPGDFIEMYLQHDFFNADRDTLTAQHDKPRMSVAQLDGIVGAGTSLWSDGGTTTYLTDQADTVVIGAATADTKLEIIGTASGRILHAQDQLRSSGSLIVDGSTVYLNSFANCTALETVNGLLTCGTDDGGTIAAGQGITVAGSVVSLTAAHSGTTISATTLLSGAVVHGQNQVRSSGSLTVQTTGLFKGDLTTRGTSSGANLTFMAGAASYIMGRLGIGKAVPTSQLDVVAAAADTYAGYFAQAKTAMFLGSENTTAASTSNESGLDLRLQTTGGARTGARITSSFTDITDVSRTSSLQFWTNLNGSFVESMRIHNNMLGIGTSSPTEKLEVVGTASGRILHAQDELRSSGSLIVDGSTIYFNAFTSCAGLSNDGVLSVTSTGQVQCQADDGGGSSPTAGQGITVAGSNIRLTAAHSGTTISATTLLSGALVHAQNELRSSGTLVVKGKTMLGTGAFLSGSLTLHDRNDPAAPTNGDLSIYAKKIANRAMLKAKGPSGLDYPYQPSFFQNQICIISPSNTTAFNSVGCLANVNTTASTPAVTETYGFMSNLATAATANDSAGVDTTIAMFFRGSTAGANGFFFNSRIAVVDTTTIRLFTGLSNQTTTTMAGADNPAGNYVGFQYTTGRSDTTWQFVTKDNTTQTVVDTNLAVTATNVYDTYLFCTPQCTTIFWRIDNVTAGTTSEGSSSTTLPTNTTALRGNGITVGNIANSAARNARIQRMYIEADR